MTTISKSLRKLALRTRLLPWFAETSSLTGMLSTRGLTNFGNEASLTLTARFGLTSLIQLRKEFNIVCNKYLVGQEHVCQKFGFFLFSFRTNIAQSLKPVNLLVICSRDHEAAQLRCRYETCNYFIKSRVIASQMSYNFFQQKFVSSHRLTNFSFEGKQSLSLSLSLSTKYRGIYHAHFSYPSLKQLIYWKAISRIE